MPLVRCNGEIAEGVTRADVVLEPHELAVLELRLTVFDIVGGSLPQGWRIGAHQTDSETP